MSRSIAREALRLSVNTWVFAVKMGWWGTHLTFITALITWNRLRRRNNLPVIVFREEDDSGDGACFFVVEGEVDGVLHHGMRQVHTIDEAFEVVTGIPPGKIQFGDRLFLWWMVWRSGLPTRTRASLDLQAETVPLPPS